MRRYSLHQCSLVNESYDTLRKEIPLTSQWGVKKSSEGKYVFWYGYKGQLAVGTESQYILGALLSSGNLNDGKAAIPLLKGIAMRLSLNNIHSSMLQWMPGTITNRFTSKSVHLEFMPSFLTTDGENLN